MSDPILKELWEIKEGLASECGQDLRRLFDKLKTAQTQSNRRKVDRSSRRRSPKPPR